MQQPIFYTAGASDALHHAVIRLQQWGYAVSPIPSTHITHLLLPVPSFENEGILKGGRPFSDVLKHLPENMVIFGGNLPVLPYRQVDFLQDEHYLSENAAITAQCALKLLEQNRMPDGKSVLLIGWGRIGKQLLPLLEQAGAKVTAAVRKEDDSAALGRSGVLIGQWQPQTYDIIINTAPAPMLCEKEAAADAFLMDLASVRGIAGENVLWARGLPARYAPEASGTLIAKTALRFALGKEEL